MVALNTVEIPGFREAIKRETATRDSGFIGGDEMVCGVRVRPLSLRTLLLLECAENGLVIRYRFDSGDEVVGHAIQALWFSRPDWKLPEVDSSGKWGSWITFLREYSFARKLALRVPEQDIVREVREWLEESFMDCPSANDGAAGIVRPSYASQPAYIMDLFASAGLPFTHDEIMDMPLKRLWQYWRLAAHRIEGVKLTNPSDQIAVDYLNKGRA